MYGKIQCLTTVCIVYIIYDFESDVKEFDRIREKEKRAQRVSGCYNAPAYGYAPRAGALCRCYDPNNAVRASLPSATVTADKFVSPLACDRAVQP